MYAWYMPIPSTGRARLAAQSFCYPLLLGNASLPPGPFYEEQGRVCVG